jgi:hypothetical protein
MKKSPEFLGQKKAHGFEAYEQKEEMMVGGRA